MVGESHCFSCNKDFHVAWRPSPIQLLGLGEAEELLRRMRAYVTDKDVTEGKFLHALMKDIIMMLGV